MSEKVWVEISKDNLIHNIKAFRDLIGSGVKFMAVVKSNAYGHGLLEVGKIASEKGADYLGVDSIDEGLKLRQAGIETPVLVLGYTLGERLAEAVENNLDLTVYNKSTIQKLGELSSESKVHIKVETGTSRQGVLPEKLKSLLDEIEKHKNVSIEGVSTHYANIEDTTDHSYAEKQLDNYKKAVEVIEGSGVKVPTKHTACSAATVLFPETYFDLVRVGISLYGLWSSKETKLSARENGDESDLKKNKLAGFELRPALAWKTKVAQVKELKAGTPVSYGLTEKVASDSKVAILPIGYWDGYDRGLSGVGNVLIKGKRCKILGRICMNMCVVDVTHIDDVNPEDEVVLLGHQGGEEITAEEIAEKIGTINYEVVTRINPITKRIIV